MSNDFRIEINVKYYTKMRKLRHSKNEEITALLNEEITALLNEDILALLNEENTALINWELEHRFLQSSFFNWREIINSFDWYMFINVRIGMDMIYVIPIDAMTAPNSQKAWMYHILVLDRSEKLTEN